MMFQASNDRTIHRRVAAATPHPDAAFKVWLRRQMSMLEGWEAELLGQNAGLDTLQALQSHKDWLRGMVEEA